MGNWDWAYVKDTHTTINKKERYCLLFIEKFRAKSAKSLTDGKKQTNVRIWIVLRFFLWENLRKIRQAKEENRYYRRKSRRAYNKIQLSAYRWHDQGTKYRTHIEMKWLTLKQYKSQIMINGEMSVLHSV